MWSWAASNVSQDFKEQDALLFSFMEELRFWLQPSLKMKLEENERKKKEMPPADLEQYATDLREGGASEEYIQKELANIRGEVDPQQETDNADDLDEFELIKGPKLNA